MSTESDYVASLTAKEREVYRHAMERAALLIATVNVKHSQNCACDRCICLRRIRAEAAAVEGK